MYSFKNIKFKISYHFVPFFFGTSALCLQMPNALGLIWCWINMHMPTGFTKQQANNIFMRHGWNFPKVQSLMY